MALPPLATVEELDARLDRPLAEIADRARAEALLRDVSAAFRRYAGKQQITAGTSIETHRAPAGGNLRLRQHPITAVTSIVDADTGDPVDFGWNEGDVDVALGYIAAARVTVTYSHGYPAGADELEILVGLTCHVAARALGVPSDSSGVQQESLGAYSFTIGSAAAAGPFGVLPAEAAILAGFRPPAVEEPIRLTSWAERWL